MSIAQSPGSASVDIEALAASFQEALAKGKPGEVARVLVKMGVKDPCADECDYENQRAHNKWVWDMIPKGMFPKLRSRLLDSLDTTELAYKVASDQCVLGLLDNFLWANINKTCWV